MTSFCSGDYLGFGWVVVGGENLVILHTIIRTTLVKQQITELQHCWLRTTLSWQVKQSGQITITHGNSNNIWASQFKL